jgi:hypothetical protein
LVNFLVKKIAHAIKRYVRIGCELMSGNDIEKAIEGLSGTSVAQIEPNRDKGNNEVRNHDTNNIIPEKPWYKSIHLLISLIFLFYISHYFISQL